MALFTVLPKKDDPDAPHASALLRHIIAEPVNVVMVILGRPEGIEEILEIAIGRAEAFRDTRRVVHVSEPEVLDADIVKEIEGTGTGKAKCVAATYGLDDKLAVRLKRGAALSRADVENAFFAAEQRKS